MTPQDIHAALVADERAPLWWPRAGMPPLTPDAPNVVMQADLEADTLPLSYSGFRALVTAWTSHAPDVAELTKPASVSYELSGPDAAELTAMIEKS
ncbi:hypothetical protein Ntsu_65830 [Nocardia sp. IFM 10818]